MKSIEKITNIRNVRINRMPVRITIMHINDWKLICFTSNIYHPEI